MPQRSQIEQQTVVEDLVEEYKHHCELAEARDPGRASHCRRELHTLGREIGRSLDETPRQLIEASTCEDHRRIDLHAAKLTVLYLHVPMYRLVKTNGFSGRRTIAI